MSNFVIAAAVCFHILFSMAEKSKWKIKKQKISQEENYNFFVFCVSSGFLVLYCEKLFPQKCDFSFHLPSSFHYEKFTLELLVGKQCENQVQKPS